MVALADALSVLFPDAVPLRDYTLVDDGTGPRIAAWSYSEPQPTPEQIAEVTADQVAAARAVKLRAAANATVTAGATGELVAVRGCDSAVWTFGRNDVIEYVNARLSLLHKALAVAEPTDQQITDEVTLLRDGVNPGIPAAEVVSRCRRRLSSAEIVALVETVIGAGWADPQT